MGVYTEDEKAQRQIKVGVLAAGGMTKAAIAKELGVSLDLVRNDLDDMEYYGVPEGVAVSAKRRKPIKHGTDGGWQAHRRRREFPCLECSLAHAGYLRSRAERAS